MNQRQHQPLIIDFLGLSLDRNDKRRLSHPLVGGVILFGRNYQSPEQLKALTEEVRGLRPDIFISTDHEGGRVQRFRSGFTKIPSMREIGSQYKTSASTALAMAKSAGQTIGKELREVGVDLTWAPVLDIDHGPSSVIGDRSFARDSALVSILASAVIDGLNEEGVQACGKHFPGHGFASADSHHEVAVDERCYEDIERDDIQPYRLLSDRLKCVMPAHVIYPLVDASPAGFSKKWLQEILRKKIGYQGAICSDDLSMMGAKVAGSALDGSVAALNAGCDLIMMCNQPLIDAGHPLDELMDGLDTRLSLGAWQQSTASAHRIKKLKIERNFRTD